MAVARSDEYDLLSKVLTHVWVPVEDLFYEIQERIAPGRALRKYTEVSGRAKKGNPTPQLKRRPLNEDQQITSGRRSLFRIAIHSGLGSGQFVKKTEDGKEFIRANVFDAEYMDKVLGAQPSPVVQTQPPTVNSTSSVELTAHDLMFDHRNVKRDIEVHGPDGGQQIVFVIKNVNDEEDLRLHFTPTAADWVADQLTMQSIRVRGSVNSRKIY